MRILILWGKEEKVLERIIPRLGFNYKLKDSLKKAKSEAKKAKVVK